MCLGTPKNNQFSMSDNGKFNIFGVPILTHIMVANLP